MTEGVALLPIAVALGAADSGGLVAPRVADVIDVDAMALSADVEATATLLLRAVDNAARLVPFASATVQ